MDHHQFACLSSESSCQLSNSSSAQHRVKQTEDRSVANINKLLSAPRCSDATSVGAHVTRPRQRRTGRRRQLRPAADVQGRCRRSVGGGSELLAACRRDAAAHVVAVQRRGVIGTGSRCSAPRTGRCRRRGEATARGKARGRGKAAFDVRGCRRGSLLQRCRCR